VSFTIDNFLWYRDQLFRKCYKLAKLNHFVCFKTLLCSIIQSWMNSKDSFKHTKWFNFASISLGSQSFGLTCKYSIFGCAWKSWITLTFFGGAFFRWPTFLATPEMTTEWWLPSQMATSTSTTHSGSNLIYLFNNNPSSLNAWGFNHKSLSYHVYFWAVVRWTFCQLVNSTEAV